MAHIENGKGYASPEKSVDALTSIMVKSQMRNARMTVRAAQRYAEAVVRAAIRRDGYTDADERLIMSDTERKQWERDNPLSD